MALQTPAVTTISVTESQPKLFNIALNLTVADDSAGYDGIDQGFTVSYPLGADIANYTAGVIDAMQAAIDSYDAAKVVQESAALSNAISTIQSGLVV